MIRRFSQYPNILLVLLLAILVGAGEPVQAQSITTQPQVVEAIAPEYPEAARVVHAEARLQVSVTINTNGTVASAKVLWGPRIFAHAALAAARKWRFVESREHYQRVAELAFVFLVTDQDQTRVSFVPPNQIEVIFRGPSRPSSAGVNPIYAKDDEHPEVIKFVAPQYPAIAMTARASGTVEVEVRIDNKGKVVAARVKKGHPLLEAPSRVAARQWEFAMSANREERIVTLTFIFGKATNRKSAKTSFVPPYQIEIDRGPLRIDY